MMISSVHQNLVLKFKARGGGRPIFDLHFGPFLGLPPCDSAWNSGPDGYHRIDFARAVWEKNGVNFWPEIIVNPIILELVGSGTSNRVPNALSHQEGSLYKVLHHKPNWSLSYLGLTKSGKIDIMAPL